MGHIERLDINKINPASALCDLNPTNYDPASFF